MLWVGAVAAARITLAGTATAAGFPDGFVRRD